MGKSKELTDEEFLKKQAEFQRRLLKTETFANYIKLHGMERAQGFYDALEIFNKEIEEVHTRKTFPNAMGGVTILPNDGTILMRKVSHLHQFTENVFHDATNDLEKHKPRKPLTDETFIPYVEKNGVEQAQGYLAALDNLYDEYEYGGYAIRLKEDGTPYSRFGNAAVGRRMKVFIEKKKQFIEQVEQIITMGSMENSTVMHERSIDPSPLNPLTAEQFPLFIKERGIKAAKGYFDCVADITAKLEDISKDKLNPSKESSLYVIGNESRELFGERVRFWIRTTKVLQNTQQGKAPS